MALIRAGILQNFTRDAGIIPAFLILRAMTRITSTRPGDARSQAGRN